MGFAVGDVIVGDVGNVVTVITWVLLDLNPIVVQILIAGEKTPYVWLEFLVQSVVTVITWVTTDLKPIVVHKLVAGEKTPIVCLKFLAESVATHGQCI